MDSSSTPHILRYAVLLKIPSQVLSEFIRTLFIGVLDVATLRFVNLGAQMPAPEWGAMMDDQLKPVYIVPGAVMLRILILNIFGDGLCRDMVAEME